MPSRNDLVDSFLEVRRSEVTALLGAMAEPTDDELARQTPRGRSSRTTFRPRQVGERPWGLRPSSSPDRSGNVVVEDRKEATA